MSEGRFPKLTIVSEKERGTAFVLKKSGYSCGRTDSNDIVLDDISVSSSHCEFVKKAGVFWVRDLGSTNGIIVDNMSVNEKVLSNNDIIKVGVVELLYDDASAEAEQIKISEIQAKPKVKTGIDLDAFEKDVETSAKGKEIFPFANAESKDLKNKLPLMVITTVIVLLILIVLGLLTWFFVAFIF